MKEVYIVTINVDNTETENENKVYGVFADKDKAVQAVQDALGEIVDDLLESYDESEMDVHNYVTRSRKRVRKHLRNKSIQRFPPRVMFWHDFGIK